MLERYYRNYVSPLWQGVVAWAQRDALYRELAALDARGLKDIGITHADIPAIVAGKFWRSGNACEDGAVGPACPRFPGIHPPSNSSGDS